MRGVGTNPTHVSEDARSHMLVILRVAEAHGGGVAAAGAGGTLYLVDLAGAEWWWWWWWWGVWRVHH